jgi:hypothetical protein
MFDACSCVLPLGKAYDNPNDGWTDAPAQDMDEMDNRLNGKTQIWADGYSFMEVTETLLMALGIQTEDCQSSQPEPGPAERTPSSDAIHGAEADG